jgi:hypothetical protein
MVVSLPFSISTVSADQQNSPATVATRTASLNVKVVLVGFDQALIDQDYLNWNLPPVEYQLIEIPGVSTNVQYAMNYSYVFPNASFTDGFVQFLQSTGKTEVRQNVIWNISYSQIQHYEGAAYYLNYTHFAVTSTNTYYPADDVEAWLVQHQSDYGGFPQNGYVLILADLSSRLPSTTPDQFKLAMQGKDVEFTSHFYNKTYTDSDLGIQLNRRYMTGWGGHWRLFFADLSAGPEQTSEQLPIQLASALNSVDITTTYGKLWLNQFLSDYISGAIPDIFAPDFIYPINYASSYKVKIVIFDNRTDTTDPPITETFNQEEALKQWQTLVPWANVTAETKYARISDYPELEQIIVKSKSPVTYGSPPGTIAVDARPVYDWLSASGQGHIKDFMQVRRDATEYDIPVFMFAFTGDYEFGFTFKEMIGREADFDRTIWGVSLYDLVLISHSSNDFKRGDFASPPQPGKGFGFTNTIIHEVGHMLGLMHPFSFDPTENFVASVMAYYPYEDIYSIFDRDVEARGQADLLLRTTSQLLSQTPNVLINQGDLSAARSKTDSAEEAYSTMNYLQAVKDAADAEQSAERAHLIAGGFMPAGTLVPLEIGVSFVLGVVIAYLVLRRRGRAGALTVPTQAQRVSYCSTCGKPLTWIPQYSRWYCYNCLKYE